MFSLTNIDYTSCPNLTSLFIDCYNCTWIVNNPDFKNNLKKLKKLQGWFKRTLQRKKIKMILKGTIPIYYHPDMKGGYMHKKEMSIFLKDLINDKKL